MSHDSASISWPHCPIHLTNLQPARAHGLSVWLCGRCLEEHASTLQTMPLEIYQIRPGVVTRYNYRMEQQQTRTQQEWPATTVLPDFSPEQLQRLADDVAAVEPSRVPRALHRKLRQWWQCLFHWGK